MDQDHGNGLLCDCFDGPDLELSQYQIQKLEREVESGRFHCQRDWVDLTSGSSLDLLLLGIHLSCRRLGKLEAGPWPLGFIMVMTLVPPWG